ncbi:hypothetical protein MMC10_005560 [Thelotrema lepadinum]|nr:hypothetical protein [Thelotrema lepadinum]
MSGPASKKQRTMPQFELLYWPTMPGRGEFIRLPLEATGVAYNDVCNEQKSGMGQLSKLIDSSSTSDSDGNPVAFAPPVLRVTGAGKDGTSLVIHQTPAILAYLAPQIGMVPEDDAGAAAYVAQIALTALDLNNETHDTHHPVGVSLYYEDQKDEALKKAKDFRENRIPKFFSYFERVLKGNEKDGKGQYLVGDKLTYADTTVWQVLDGLYFAFPKEIAAREKEYPLLIGSFYPKFKQEKGIKDYLASDRRLPYSMGIFRHYPELDR